MQPLPPIDAISAMDRIAQKVAVLEVQWSIAVGQRDTAFERIQFLETLIDIKGNDELRVEAGLMEATDPAEVY